MLATRGHSDADPRLPVVVFQPNIILPDFGCQQALYDPVGEGGHRSGLPHFAAAGAVELEMQGQQENHGHFRDGQIIELEASGNHALRSNWCDSFYLPADPLVSMVLYGGSGAVTGSSGSTVAFNIGGAGEFGALNGAVQSASVAIQAGGATSTGFQAVYITDPPAPKVVSVSSLNPVFPGGSLPIAVLVVDAVGRIQQTIDMRPSNLSVIPSLGTMTESVASPTLRSSLQNSYRIPRSYALSPQIPAEIALPASGFFLGSGSVVLGGNTITTPTTYLTSAKGGLLVPNAINQGYISPSTGLLSIQQVTVSGVFPANSLNLFEAVTDSGGLIRSVTDFRESYV